MNLRAVIVEDEPPARRRLRRLLDDNGQIDVVADADTVRDAVRKIDRHEPDVVFLDIRIPGGDGFEVLARIAEVPPVVFVTAYDDYAVRAFESDAVDYVVKPVEADRLGEAIDRVRRRIEKQQVQPGLEQALSKRGGMPSRLVTRRRGRIVLLDPTEVSHVTADHTLVFAWREGQSYLVPRTLHNLAKELEPLGFRRTHRSALVNLGHIGSVQPADSGNFVLEIKGDEEMTIPLSRRRARSLRKEIGF